MDYLERHFIAFTSDGASVLTEMKSGVMELLMRKWQFSGGNFLA